MKKNNTRYSVFFGNIVKIFRVACFGFLVSSTVHIAYAQDLTISVDPRNTNQHVAFGGDGKLTIKDWAEVNVNVTAQKLYSDMDLSILRVPIFALQPISDNIYDNVITVVQAVQSVNPQVKIFASIANGDGYGVDHHGASKFPESMRGCCANNVYTLNLTAYAAYLDSFMRRMNEAGVNIDYLGPWNEDPASESDYSKTFSQMNNLGNTQKIGLEAWGLLTSVSNVDKIEGHTDIIGSHFYDDGRINDQDAAWANLVNASSNPVWYTEATRYATADNIGLLVAGMDNIFPSIRSGAEAVVFYQVVKRFVYANGSELPIKYSGFKNLVNNASGKAVAQTTSSDGNVSAVSFANDNTLSIHIINKNTSSQQANINLGSNQKASGTITRTIWDGSNTEVSNQYNLGGNKTWNVTLPANSYVHLNVPFIDD